MVTFSAGVSPSTTTRRSTSLSGPASARAAVPHAATKATIASARWMHRRDIGVMDQRGYVAITGRSDPMVIVGGETACPAKSRKERAA
jgi:acyl-CoA synthetase (AMP-forming)/AMP-acid ligase II